MLLRVCVCVHVCMCVCVSQPGICSVSFFEKEIPMRHCANDVCACGQAFAAFHFSKMG
jgi:hypothetical protein